MYWTKERLLEHLPYLYRERDAEIAARDGLAEGPLSSLFGAIAAQLGAVENNVEQLYDNWFVETCEPWVLPYIGALLGLNRLPATSSAVFTPRAFIANAMNGRRRKGTPAMLEQLARDSTGWSAHIVEYFRHLAQYQHLNRYRSTEFLTPDLRDPDAIERLPGPFTSTNRLPEIRNIDGPYPGRFNIPNVGLHLWPLLAIAPPASGRFAIEARAEAESATPARWYLHPLGVAAPLFNRPLGSDPSEGTVVTTLARERDVPEPLRRLPLHLELEALRQSMPTGPRRRRCVISEVSALSSSSSPMTPANRFLWRKFALSTFPKVGPCLRPLSNTRLRREEVTCCFRFGAPSIRSAVRLRLRRAPNRPDFGVSTPAAFP